MLLEEGRVERAAGCAFEQGVEAMEAAVRVDAAA